MILRAWYGEMEPVERGRREAKGASFIRLSHGLTHYELGGPAGGRPVVLVHGFSVPMFIWEPTFTALTGAGYRVLRYDLYGRGLSDRPPLRYDKALFVRQLSELIEAVAMPRPFALFGLSMGGAIAAAYTAQAAEAVERLALLDPAGLPYPIPTGMKLLKLPLLGELLMGPPGTRLLLQGLRDDLGADHPALPDYEARYRRQMRYFGFRRALLSTVRSGVLWQGAEDFAAVGRSGLPVLLIWGEEDRVVPFALHQRLLELIPQAEFHPIPGARHIPHYAMPEVVNPVLLEFLRGRDEADRGRTKLVSR